MLTNLASQLYATHPDPSFADCNVSIGIPEADDWMHNPDEMVDDNGTICTWRGLENLGCIALLCVLLLAAM